MAHRKTPRFTGRARAARRHTTTTTTAASALAIEGLEVRQLLSAATHLCHHWHKGFHITPSATPNFVITSHHKNSSARPAGSSSPFGFTPAAVRHAYGIDATTFEGITGDGSGQTIAIVDAYNDPGIQGDLATFDQQFGLPAPTLTVEGQTGSTSFLPGTDPAGPGNSWAVETSLDVEWAHTVAPAAKILLVEANSAAFTDLFTAVDVARNAAGVSVVSMSFGGAEFSGETNQDTHFTTPNGHQGVTFIASTGDSGAYVSSTGMGVEYPAASSNVLAVGGTRLTVDSNNNYASETGWGNGTSSFTSGGAGGGISRYVSQPTYQQGTVTQSTTRRTVPDVAFLADPASGVAVVDSYDMGASTPWLAVGGTSLAAPMWAGVMAMIDQGRVINGLTTLDGPTGTLPAVYQLSASDFHDITSGDNGYAAGSGYDLVTGRGTPIVNLLAPDLSGGPATAPLPSNVTASPGAAYTYSAAAGTLSLTSGTLTFSADVGATQPLSVTASGVGANLVFETDEHLAGLTLHNGAAATDTGGPATTLTLTGALTLDTNGLLSLGRAGMVLDSSTTSLDTVRSYLQTAYNGGTWDGPGGITSADVEADPTQLAVAYVSGANPDNASMNAALTSILSSPTAIYLRAAQIGDMDLNGVVDRIDVRQFNTRGAFDDGSANHDWADGDFNADGIVDRFDVRAFNTAGNFNNGVTF